MLFDSADGAAADPAAGAAPGLLLAINAACACAYSNASFRISPAVWRSSAKKSISSGSRTSCASTPRCPYQLMTSLRYAITVWASGVSAPTAAFTDAGLAAAADCGAQVTATGGAAPDVGATDAPCDEVAGLCANAGALAIATAIANAPATS